MRLHRVKFRDPQAADGVYHCMSRTVNGELCLGTREKEVFRKMLHQVADFSGVEVLTYCIMRNHFHILLRVFQAGPVPDAELVRRFGVLCPKTTKYQSAKAKDVELILKVMEAGGGALPVWSLLRCRVHYFTDGAILGSWEFIEAHLQEWRRRHPLKKAQKTRKYRCEDAEEWTVIHNFREPDVS